MYSTESEPRQSTNGSSPISNREMETSEYRLTELAAYPSGEWIMNGVPPTRHIIHKSFLAVAFLVLRAPTWQPVPPGTTTTRHACVELCIWADPRGDGIRTIIGGRWSHPFMLGFWRVQISWFGSSGFHIQCFLRYYGASSHQNTRGGCSWRRAYFGQWEWQPEIDLEKICYGVGWMGGRRYRRTKRPGVRLPTRILCQDESDT